MNADRTGTSPTITDALKRLTDGMSKLVRDHIALARTELKQDLRAAGKDVLLAAAGLPSLLLGYAFVMAALAFWLAQAIGIAGGFAVIGMVNLGIGGTLAFVFGRRLAGRDKPDLDRTTAQIKEGGKWLRELRNG